MTKKEILKRTRQFVEEKLGRADSTGHDWLHIQRVVRNAAKIGSSEKVDMFVVELGALLHDIADWKFHGGDKEVGPIAAGKWLNSLKVEKDIIEKVVDIVGRSGFKSHFGKRVLLSLEGQIVQDADRLDALGAIGIARAFSYGGKMDRSLFDPKVKPRKFKTTEEYRLGGTHTVNHFYEKLLLLKGLMNTKTGQRMALERHKYMENYLKRFYKEWEGQI